MESASFLEAGRQVGGPDLGPLSAGGRAGPHTLAWGGVEWLEETVWGRGIGAPGKPGGPRQTTGLLFAQDLIRLRDARVTAQNVRVDLVLSPSWPVPAAPSLPPPPPRVSFKPSLAFELSFPPFQSTLTKC